MSSSYNKVLLMGNLTRDPELRHTPSNMPVTQIGVAVNERWKNKQTDQWEERVNFIDCEAWGRTAEIINQYFTKGRPIFIEGRLRMDQWEDKQSGQKRSKLKVVVDSFQFIGSRDGGGGREGGGGGGGSYNQGNADRGGGWGNDPAPASSGGPHEAVDEGDIPF